ncbi:helix-turn-helix transcriptional regulator [Sphaerimonospora thailandensis]|uniref:LuxR family transcriptional regulator n=1 Tax=Sphaerimonospora thailandensis TaxID=795644 RepID=A0A8J3R2N3_9ACTN|nr:LuxR family transcriptional regulator [Sphaerimonospora thailandensis]GIH67927.1 LuxR family transcriptional regulator [Sphaerimonospora thailandensis]
MTTPNPWPLVGRAAALQTITEAATQPDAGGVVIVGPPGVGRTRLAKEAVARLAAAGHPTAWATGTRAAGVIPLGALLHLAPPGDVAVPVTEHVTGRVFGRIAERFGVPTGKRPVLVVDDTHLLDSASAALVYHLAVHTRTFVLLTVRQGQTAPDVMTALWKEWVVRRLELRPLSDGDVDTLLERGLGGPLDAVTRRTFRRLSAGNPLVLRELVQSGLEGSVLRRVDSLWHLGGQLRITGRFGDLVEAQMQVDDPAVLAVLEVLACTEPLGQPLLEDITGHSAVVRAERQGLVVVEPSGARHQTRFTIPAYGEVIRARMPRARARAIWGRLARALATSPCRRADDALELAVWRLRAGLGSSAPELLAAARRAAERSELKVAERLAVASRDTSGGAASGGADANLTLAEVLVSQGRYGDAAGVLPAPEECDDEERADRRAMLRETIEYWQHRASPDQGQPTGGGAAEAVRTWTILLEGQVARSLAAGKTLLARPYPRLPVRATVLAATAVVFAAGLVGDVDLVERASADGLEIASAHRAALPWAQAQVGGVRCLALLLGGALTTAAEAVAAAYGEAVETQTAPLVGMWAAVRGIVAKAQGRVELAQQALREAIVLLDGHDPLRLRRVYLAELAGTHAMAGDAVQADAWLSRMDSCPAPPGVLFDPWIERNRAWAAAAALDLSGAATRAVMAAKAAREAGAPMIEALALFDAARFGAAKEVCGRLRRLAGDIATPATAAFAAVATALAADDAHRLVEAARTLHRIGHPLPAAEAAAAAYRLHAAAGRRTAAQKALVFAREALAECGGARTPLTDLTGSEASLTPRELQVAQLTAAGLSGRAVADRLGLSLRTVNNHLGRVYAKLGVSGRHVLAQVLGRPLEQGRG